MAQSLIMVLAYICDGALIAPESMLQVVEDL